MLCCKPWCALAIPVGEPQLPHSLSLTILISVKNTLVPDGSGEIPDFYANLTHECADLEFTVPYCLTTTP
jgi:hypothetical protein